MANWVIRRVSDGRFWCGYSLYTREVWSSDLKDAVWYGHDDRAVRTVKDGEEWVELDDAGQPVEAKAVRMWVVELGGRYYGHGNSGPVHDLANASRFPCEQDLRLLPGRNVPVLVRPDGAVTLDEPAPTIAQPSPDDEPIPYRLAPPTSDEPIPVTTAELITAECAAIAKMLLAKNAAYGDSALSPVRIFSRADSVEQIRVRIDDKLSRLARGNGTETEDVVSDLIGYLVLLRIAQRKAGK